MLISLYWECTFQQKEIRDGTAAILWHCPTTFWWGYAMRSRNFEFEEEKKSFLFRTHFLCLRHFLSFSHHGEIDVAFPMS